MLKSWQIPARMPKTDPPALTAESSEHARKIAEDLHARLVAFSQETAWSSKHDNIQCSDVNKGLLALKNAGLEDRPPWYRRPNLFITFGSLLVGIAPSLSSLCYTVIKPAENPAWFAILVLMLPSFMAGAGAVMAFFGWVSDTT